MDSAGRGAFVEGGAPAGIESARLRAAMDRQAARRSAIRPVGHPLVGEPAVLAGTPDLTAVRRKAWLIPKEPFVAAGRLALALIGISGLVLLGLLLASAVALLQMHLQGR